MTTGVFTYYAYDMMTMTLLAELPLTNVTFNRTLNTAGVLSGELAIADPSNVGIGTLAASQPGRTNLFVDLDGQIIWAGIIWTRDYDSSTKIVKIGAKELWSYWERRMQIDYTSPPGASGQYWQTNPATLLNISSQVIADRSYTADAGVGGPVLIQGIGASYFYNHGTNYTTLTLDDGLGFPTPAPGPLATGSTLYLLFNNGTHDTVTTTSPVAQGDTTIHIASYNPTTTIEGEHIWQPFSTTTPFVGGMIVPTEGWPMQMRMIQNIVSGSPSTVTGTYPKQQLQTVEAIVRQHSSAGIGTGFDFSIDCSWLFGQGGPVQCQFNFWFPLMGQDWPNNLGAYGRMIDLGTALNYVWSEDSFTQADVVYGIGQASAYLESIQSSSHVLADNYPVLEALFPHITLNTQSELIAATAGELSQFAWPVFAPKITLPAFGPEPYLGKFGLGDVMRLYESANNLLPPSYFPQGLESDLRVVDITVNVADEGITTMDLTLNITPVLDPPRPVGLGL